MKQWWVLFLPLVFVVGCNSRRPLPTQEELLQQDSLERIAHVQSVQTRVATEEEMLSQLPLQTLPVTYQEGFERSMPGFMEIPPTMVPPLLGVNGLTKTKAVRLPDTEKGYHVILLGGLNAKDEPVSYMVTLDDKTWEPIDQLTIYEESLPDEEDAEDEFIDEEDLGMTRVEFSVTSRYEIYMQVVFQSYVDDSRELEGVSVFSIGSDGSFFELEDNKLNAGAQ
jgi:hypothetical protein